MGNFSSKLHAPDSAATMESYTKELGAKFEALKDKLEEISSNFVQKTTFNDGVTTIFKKFEEDKQEISKLFDQEKQIHAQNELIISQVQIIQDHVNEQKELVNKVQGVFSDRLESFKQLNKDLEQKMLILSQQVQEVTNTQKEFIINRLTHANGINKVQKNATKRTKKSKKKQHGMDTRSRRRARLNDESERSTPLRSIKKIDHWSNQENKHEVNFENLNWLKRDDNSSFITDTYDVKPFRLSNEKNCLRKVDLNIFSS